MADQNLALTGKDVRLELLFDGIPQKIMDEIVSFTEDARYATHETMLLGTTNVDIDKEPLGWQGEIEVARKTSQLDDFIDAWNFARRNSIPAMIIIVRTNLYRDGTSVTHTYPDVKVEFGTRTSRSGVQTSRLPWVCGTDRI